MTVIYERSGCTDIRFFKDREEFDDWMKRQLVINPDTKVITIEEGP